MTRPEIKLDTCPCCGGEARAQFEVYGTWVRVFCVACGLSTMSVPTHNYDPTPAAELWSARPIEDALANHIIKLEAEIAKLRAKLDAGETVDQLGKPDWVGKEVRK